MSLLAFTSYLELEKQYSSHTVQAYLRDIRAFEAFLGQEVPLAAVAYSDIRNWIVSLVSEGITNRSVNRKIASLKAYYKFLKKIGEITADPLARHKALKTEKKVQVPFSEQEMWQVLHAIDYEDSFEGQRDKLILELLYTTGMRRAELIGLKNNDIDWSRDTLKVLGKRNKERILPLLPELKGAMKRYELLRRSLPEIQDEAYFLVTKSGHKLYETLVYRVIIKYLSKVSPKVKKSPHMLRHTFATHLLNQGADLNSVKELLGHASLASTQVYTHSSIAQLKEVHAATHPRNKE